MEMNLRVLFRTRNISTVEQLTRYSPVPAGLDYRQAIQMLRARRGLLLQAERKRKIAAETDRPHSPWKLRGGWGRSDFCKRIWLHLGENNDQGEQREGLDKGQTENQEGEDASASAGVAGQSFDGRSNRPALTEAAHAGGQTHTQTSADRHQTDGGRATIREGRNGETKSRQGHEYVLKFPHISPASFGIGCQWVVEAHRAGPLTLAAYR